VGKSIVLILLAFVFLAIAAVSCTPKPTSTSFPTSFPPSVTYPSTGTAVPEDTPRPTSTALPPTPIPPSLVAEYLTDVKALYYDPLDSTGNWNINTNGEANNGVLEMQGSLGWTSSVSPNSKFVTGNGIVLKFKVQAASGESTFVFDTGRWQTDSFKQFGIDNIRRPLANLWQGTDNLGRNFLNGKLRLKPDTWYGLMMAIGENGRFLAVMWDLIDETHRIVHEVVREDWSGQSWAFSARANEGETIYIDDFYRISFGEIK
jgi:hypothetical protein